MNLNLFFPAFVDRFFSYHVYIHIKKVMMKKNTLKKFLITIGCGLM